MFLGIKLEAWLTILAILLGPLLAFEVQRKRDNRRERRNRKLDIYRRLVMTLKAPMAANHVDAINSIQLEFYDDKGVMDAWRLYISHLNNHQQHKAEPARWMEKKFDLLVELVYLIGQSLGYKYVDRTAIRDHTYVPQGYEDVELEGQRIRKAVLEVLTGRHPLVMTMLGPVQVEKPIPPIPEKEPPRPLPRPKPESE
jgi:hypothetical protein